MFSWCLILTFLLLISVFPLTITCVHTRTYTQLLIQVALCALHFDQELNVQLAYVWEYLYQKFMILLNSFYLSTVLVLVLYSKYFVVDFTSFKAVNDNIILLLLDINECEMGFPCGDHQCINTIGSYECSCIEGYYLSNNYCYG